MPNVLQAPYRIDGEFVVPGPNAASGWNGRLQSGHVISPLLAHLVERVPTLAPMMVTRCTVDLTRAVPMKPLRWRTEVLREGKKLQLVRAALYEDGVEYCSLTALRARIAESPAPLPRTYPQPETMPPMADFEVKGHEIRTRDGVRRGNGQCTIWSRLLRQVVEDQAPTPFAHAMSIADFGSGMANLLRFDEWRFPNIDIVVMFFRPPQGDWLLLDAESETAGNGLGLVSGALADSSGVFARSHQTLFIDPVRRD